MTRYYNLKVRAWTELEGTIHQKCACGFTITFIGVGDEVECPSCGQTKKYTGRKEIKRKPTKRDRHHARRDHGKAISGRKRQPPITVLVFDTETTYDIYLNLTFGSYLLAWIDPNDFTFHPYEEGLFYADALPETNPEGYAVLKGYWEKGRPRPNEGKLIAPKDEDFPKWLYANHPNEFWPIFEITKQGRVKFDEWYVGANREAVAKRSTEYLGHEVKDLFSGMVALHEPDQIERWKATGDDPWAHVQGMLNLIGAHKWQPERWVDENGIEHQWPNPPYSSRVRMGKVQEARIERGMPRTAAIGLQFMSASAFVNDVLYGVCFPKYSRQNRKRAGREPKQATIVTANGGFDLSRLARAVKPGGPTGSKFNGGFSMRLLPNENEDADTFESLKHGNNVRIVRRGARGTMFSFSDMDAGDRDYYTDVLNLGWSLTNQVYSLDSLSQMYATEHRKSKSPDFSRGIDEYQITYNRDDVLATLDSYCGLLREVWKHPLQYDETRAYSPAALPKAYYNAMGMVAPLEKQPNFLRNILGYTMGTFFAGRAEAHIRRVPDTPVDYYDFTSMYPTVNINMRLWDFLVSDGILVKEETADIQAFLDSLTLDDMFRRETWLKLRGIGLVQPNEDILPVRARFAGDTDTIATAYVTGETDDDSLWWSLPDLVLSKLLTGKAPKVTLGIRFYPSGNLQDGLQRVTLDKTPIDPSGQDFFKVAMEQRQLVKIGIKGNGHGQCSCDSADGHKADCQCEDCHGNCVCWKCSLSSSLKVTATSGSYGIYAEFNQEPNTTIQHRKDYQRPKIKIHGIKRDPVINDGDKIDMPGPYAFPPMAALITGAARLMLGTLEACVTEVKGTWVSCDTDSMTIPVTDNGGIIETTGGQIPTLSRETMQQIRDRFESLNPYDPKIKIRLLKREHEPTADDPRQLYIYAISAKRYGLWRYRPDGSVEVVKAEGRKEHGLGAYLSPYDPNNEDVEKGKRQHVTEIWEYLISRKLGLPIDEPSFFNLPVMCKISVSTWNSYNMFKHFNGICECDDHPLKPYSLQIKPYNFAMSPVVDFKGVNGIRHITHRKNHGSQPLRLIAPYERDPEKWLLMQYMDANEPTSPGYDITTEILPGHIQVQSDTPVRVQTWRDVAESFDVHPEVKYCDADDKTCSEGTIGILQRHHIKIGRITYIGKESNRLTEKDEPLPDLAPYEVPDYGSGRDDVRELVIPVLRANGFESRQASESWHGLSRRKLANAITSSEGRQIGEYLALDNLTQVSDTQKGNIRDPLIRLAVKVALPAIPDSYRDKKWATVQGQRDYCWDILDTWGRVKGPNRHA